MLSPIATQIACQCTGQAWEGVQQSYLWQGIFLDLTIENGHTSFGVVFLVDESIKAIPVFYLKQKRHHT